MPLFGTLDVADRVDGAPQMLSLDTEPLVLERADVLQVLYEIASPGMQDMLPAALHPTLPPTLGVLCYRVRNGPLGPFTLVQIRIGCRAGVRPRGYLLSSVVDSADAAAALSGRWALRADPGEPMLRVYHDRIDLRVTRDDRTILDVGLVDPEPVHGNDIQYVAGMHLARTPRGPRLVQVDPEFTFHRADRGRPDLVTFDAAAWGDDRIRPVFPVSASYTVADVTLPRLRYVSKADVPALQGTETV